MTVDDSAHQVQIINREQQQEHGSITMAKYIREGGMLMRPQKDASYVFLVSGPSFNELITLDAVSYTHLDVYKRQMLYCVYM